MDWPGRLRVGRGTAVGSPVEAPRVFLNGRGGLDQGLHRQTWFGMRQLPGTHQHRPLWGVSCVPRARLTPIPGHHPGPGYPTCGEASGGV